MQTVLARVVLATLGLMTACGDDSSAGRDGGAIRVDSGGRDSASADAATDAGSAMDSASATDAATETDAASGTDSATGADAATETDSATRVDSATGTDAATETDSATVADSGATGIDAASIVCGAGGGGSFPSFSRACAVSDDCFVGLHTINCCGTQRALGLAKFEQTAFETAETVCDAMYPPCGCAQGPTMTDTGESSLGETISVDCRAGECTTFIRM